MFSAQLTFVTILIAVLFLQAGGSGNKPSRQIATRDKSRADSARTSLLEIGQPAKLSPPRTEQGSIKIISYNIRWRSGDDLKKLIDLFRNDPQIGSAAIMGLQEVDRRKKRSANTNTAKQLADALGLHYAWAAPPPGTRGDEEETGVAIFSAYALEDVTRLVLPNEGPDHRRRVALGATVHICKRAVRFYSVHSETRISLDKKLGQMNAVLNDAARYPKDMPVIVLGDFNTWDRDAGRRTTKLFTDAGYQTPFGAQTTFSRRVLFVPIELRLDWVWLRGMRALTYGIDRKVDISDHWPLWTVVELPNCANA